MAAMNKRGVRLADWLVSLKAGTLEVLSPKETLKFGGRVWTRPELVNTVDGYVAKYDAAEQARISAKTRLAERDAIAAEAAMFAKDMSERLRLEHKRDPETLAKFGLAPPKVRRPLTAQEKVVAAAKARATRDARNTLGSRQRLAIKAQVASALPGQTNTIVLTDAPLPKDTNGTSH